MKPVRQNENPPAWAARFFRWYCNDHLSDAVLGDMLELYVRRKNTLGKRRADLLFVWNVLCFLQPFAIKKRTRSSVNSIAMIQNYFTISWRAMSRQKVFILINVVGMSIAIACCITAYCTYDFNAQFDRYHKKAATIYRVNAVREFQHDLTELGYVPLPLGESIRQNIGDVINVIRYSPRGADIRPRGADVRVGDDVFATGLSFVDADFFDVFTFEFTEGNPQEFKDKNKIFISETQAITFFGKEPALGKPVTQIFSDGRVREFTIGGVFKLPPANSSFNDNAFTLYDNYFDETPETEKGTNWRYPITLFVVVNNPSRIPSIEKQLKPFALTNNAIREDFVIKEFKLDPFEGMAWRDRKADRQGRWTREAVSMASIVGSIAMATLILLIACFNLTNTAVAVSSRRLKEIGIRKVMGGLRWQLILQFLGETTFICFVSLALGIVLAEIFLLPSFNSLWPYLKLTTHYTSNPEFLIFLVVTLIFIGLLAGSYPALYISQFQPISILKGRLRLGGTNFFTRTLLTLQYAISLIAIVCSLAFIGNAGFQRDFDLGFDNEGVVYTYVNDGNEFEILKNALNGYPKIRSIAGSKDHVLSRFYRDPIQHEGKKMEVVVMDVGDNYLNTAGFHLVAGRDFRKDAETDYRESVIITEKLAAKFGWNRPLGKEIIWKDTTKLYVIGVVKDAYTQGLWREMEPMMIRFTPPKNYIHLVVSVAPKNLEDVNQFMAKKWKEIFPNRVYYSHYTNGMVEAARVNNSMVKMFVFLGIVAMMLSATGLFTLVSINILRKMKEIGVRKVFGASLGNIATVINAEFVIILVIASMIGAFAGVYLSTSLMRSIWNYYQAANTIVIGTSVFILFAISALTIGFKVYNTTKMNPINTLKDE